MLEVGVNSYVSVGEADRYVSENYTRYAPIRVHWSVLDMEEKEAYIRQSMAQIEKLPIIGRKYAGGQRLQFPRYVPGSRIYLGNYPYYYSATIPQSVKDATVENALGVINEEINAVSDKQFMTLQSLGAVKNTKYNRREAGDIGFSAELKGGTTVTVLSSKKAFALMRGWIGGYRC